jgi:hypothetical protein
MPRLVRHLGELDRGQMWELLDSGPVDDLRAIDARMSQAVPVVQRNANRVYDRYLRAHGVDAGIASYDAVVDLVVGTGRWWAQ